MHHDTPSTACRLHLPRLFLCIMAMSTLVHQHTTMNNEMCERSRKVHLAKYHLHHGMLFPKSTEYLLRLFQTRQMSCPYRWSKSHNAQLCRRGRFNCSFRRYNQILKQQPRGQQEKSIKVNHHGHIRHHLFGLFSRGHATTPVSNTAGGNSTVAPISSRPKASVPPTNMRV